MSKASRGNGFQQISNWRSSESAVPLFLGLYVNGARLEPAPCGSILDFDDEKSSKMGKKMKWARDMLIFSVFNFLSGIFSDFQLLFQCVVAGAKTAHFPALS